MEDWNEKVRAREAEEERGKKPPLATNAHCLLGHCQGMKDARRTERLEEMKKALHNMRSKLRGEGNGDCLRVVATAYAVVAAAARGEASVAGKEQAFLQVLSGALPKWDTKRDLKQRREVERCVVGGVHRLQATAIDAVSEWRGSAHTGIEFMHARIKHHEWLRLIMHAWREEAADSSVAAAGRGQSAPCPRRAAIANIAENAETSKHASLSHASLASKSKKVNRPSRTVQKVKTVLTRLRLIEHPTAKVRRARVRIREVLEKELQRRKDEAARQAEADRVSETRQARGDRPCANTRHTSTQLGDVASDEGGSAKPKKEPRWSGGTTRVRSKIGEHMVEMIRGLENKGDG